MTPDLEARYRAYSMAVHVARRPARTDAEHALRKEAMALLETLDVGALLRDAFLAIRPPSFMPVNLPLSGPPPQLERPMIHEAPGRSGFPGFHKYNRTGCETGRFFSGNKTKTFSWPDSSVAGGMEVVVVIVSAASDKGSSYRNISFKYDNDKDFEVCGFPLEVLKDIVEWAYAPETTTLAQRAVGEWAAEHGMTQTGKSEGRVYGARGNLQNIPKTDQPRGDDYVERLQVLNETFTDDHVFCCQQCGKTYKFGSAKMLLDVALATPSSVYKYPPLAFCSVKCGDAYLAKNNHCQPPVFAEIPIGKPETCNLMEAMDASFAALQKENLPVDNCIPEWQRTDTTVPLYDKWPEPVASEVRQIANTIGWNEVVDVEQYAEKRMKKLGLEMPKPAPGS